MQAVDKAYIFETTGNIKVGGKMFDPATDSDKNGFFNKLYSKGHDSDLSQKLQAILGNKGSNVNDIA